MLADKVVLTFLSWSKFLFISFMFLVKSSMVVRLFFTSADLFPNSQSLNPFVQFFYSFDTSLDY